MLKYLIAIVTSYFISVFLIPILIKISFKIDFTDKPTKRKKHLNDTPLIGGLSMYISFSIIYLMYSFKYQIAKTLCIFIGATIILLIGLVDDYYKTQRKEFKIAPRIFIQIGVATMMFFNDIVFKGFTNPISESFISFPIWLQYLCTITWIVGVVTVINWSDGMDGVAGSIVSISTITLLLVSLVKNQITMALTAAILLGSTLGFLKFNKQPAKIFMGDSGANFLGFILAIIALEGSFKQATLISVLIPFIILGVPIIDNIFVIIFRILKGKEFYKADKSQIHYRLQSKGLNKSQILIYISILSGILSLISIILALLKI